jgi:SNF2 family DNA or RNA helicase
MGYEDRQANIDAFNEDEDVRIFLLSTRAGGLVSLSFLLCM